MAISIEMVRDTKHAKKPQADNQGREPVTQSLMIKRAMRPEMNRPDTKTYSRATTQSLCSTGTAPTDKKPLQEHPKWETL